MRREARGEGRRWRAGMCARALTFSSAVNSSWWGVSIISRIQFTCSWFQMWVYSTPIRVVYTCWSRPIRSRSFTSPRPSSISPSCSPPVPRSNSLSRSASVNP